MKGRTPQERLDAIEETAIACDAFRKRVAEAATLDEIAGLMAEAIDMQIAANGLEPIKGDGRAMVAYEEIAAAHCLIAARDAFRRMCNDRGR